jgi:hypothetical protein
VDVMEPGNESRDLIHVEAPSTPKTEMTRILRHLFRKLELHRLQKSKS